MIENAVYQGESELQMRELISKHFTCENELAIWSKDICQTVNKLIYIIRFTSQKQKITETILQHAANFSDGCIFIAVKAKIKRRNAFSGKYYLHSNRNNIGVYIREPGTVINDHPQQLFLIYSDGIWLLDDDSDKSDNFLWGHENLSGHLCIATTGSIF